MKIYQWPHETLSQKATQTNITDFTLDLPDDDIDRFQHDVIKTMIEGKGIGLAANQLGYLARFFCIGHSYFSHFRQPTVIWNPKIIKVSPQQRVDEEGCLSFKGWLVTVKRPRIVEVEYETVKGGKHRVVLDGYESKCFQHEYDHLEGIIFNKLSKTRWAMKKRIK